MAIGRQWGLGAIARSGSSKHQLELKVPSELRTRRRTVRCWNYPFTGKAAVNKLSPSGSRGQSAAIVRSDTPASGSPPDGLLWRALDRAREDLAPDAHLIPALIPVGTDARFFRPRGTISYGVGLFDHHVGFGDFLGMFHGHDERVSEESLRLTTEFLGRTVSRFGEESAA